MRPIRAAPDEMDHLIRRREDASVHDELDASLVRGHHPVTVDTAARPERVDQGRIAAHARRVFERPGPDATSAHATQPSATTAWPRRMPPM